MDDSITRLSLGWSLFFLLSLLIRRKILDDKADRSTFNVIRDPLALCRHFLYMS